ncbi:MAG: hypothetical protein ACK5AZ_26285 [Bryobacteraceae bacterium]
MKWFLLLLPVSLLLAAEPRITYVRSFPGSTPPYVEILLERDGSAIYKESADDDEPLRFKLHADEVDEVFALADKLDRFKRPLESNLKVANMGKKTFRYEDGENKNEVDFNYSLDPDARTLADWFQRMIETQQHRLVLERTVRFDKLGVNKALLQLEAALDRNRIVSFEEFLPMLDRVVKSESYLHMARERAAYLAETFRSKRKTKVE